MGGFPSSTAGPDDVIFEILNEYVRGAPALRRVVMPFPVLAHGADVAGFGRGTRR